MTFDVEIIVTDPRIEENGWMPERATDGSAAFDLRACLDAPVVLEPQNVFRFDLGFRLHVSDPGYAAIILPRSGKGGREGLVLANTAGLIDSDYQGPLMAIGLNRNPPGGVPVTVEPGERVFQMAFVPVAAARLVKVAAFSSGPTGRGEGGYGSTGKG